MTAPSESHADRDALDNFSDKLVSVLPNTILLEVTILHTRDEPLDTLKMLSAQEAEVPPSLQKVGEGMRTQ